MSPSSYPFASFKQEIKRVVKDKKFEKIKKILHAEEDVNLDTPSFKMLS